MLASQPSDWVPPDPWDRPRTVAPLPSQVLDHCTVCLEERLYTQAFALLSSAFITGEGTPRPRYLPPIQHLSLAGTLIVHPSITTRTTSRDKHAAATSALQYLQDINALSGPVDAEFAKAFQFGEGDSSRAKRVKTRRSEAASPAAEEDEPGHIRSNLVSEDGLWSKADDFWCVVGWAFNCSVLHKHRWEYWKSWLSFMIDVLKRDLAEHRRHSDSPPSDHKRNATGNPLDKAMLSQYLSQIGEGRGSKRRVMRAILADGSRKALAEFPEIWKNETKQPKKKNDDEFARKRKLDLEQDEYGDYFEDSDGDSPTTASLRASRSASQLPSTRPSLQPSDDEMDADSMTGSSRSGLTEDPLTIDAFGGTEAIHLRQRLLALLVRFSLVHPTAFLDTEDLFDLYTEFLRPLPLPVFRQLVVPAKRYLDSDVQASMEQMLLRPLLASSAPIYSQNAVTQEDFEEYYAPYTANVTSVVENAKVSLLIEDLMRLLWTTGRLKKTRSLCDAVGRGLLARSNKAVFDGRRKKDSKYKVEEEAAFEMECSAKRMRTLLEII